jgi:hypothetical protein
MIESFLYGTWIGGQVLYWFFLKGHTELRNEECWRNVQSGYRLSPRPQCHTVGGVRRSSQTAR